MRVRPAAIVLALFTAVSTAKPVAAHPGTGIVIDRAGNVFYTDLVHVWRIAPDGKKTIAVRDVHTHELSIDPDGTIYGEDSEYMGGDRWRHKVWKRAPNGRVSDVIPWTDGFWREFGFVRDSRGATYWTRCPDRVCVVRKRAPNGVITTVPMKHRFEEQVQWLAAAPDGSLYLLDKGKLKALKPDGSMSTVATALGDSPMGLVPDGAGGVYVSVYGRRAVLRVSRDGVKAVAATSRAPWGPSGIAIAANGDKYILEYSTSNAARVRRITAAGRETIY